MFSCPRAGRWLQITEVLHDQPGWEHGNEGGRAVWSETGAQQPLLINTKLCLCGTEGELQVTAKIGIKKV